MFCIVNEIEGWKKNNLIRYENDRYSYYELFCKKFSPRMQRRTEHKLGCPIVFAGHIDTKALRLQILENLLIFIVQKHPGAQVAIVSHPQPDALLKKIIPYCREIHLIGCADIDTGEYLRVFGYVPVQLDQYGTESVIFKYAQGKLYISGQEIFLEDNGYILPENVAEMLPQGISELEFAALLWKYGGYDAQHLLPGDVIHYTL